METYFVSTTQNIYHLFPFMPLVKGSKDPIGFCLCISLPNYQFFFAVS